MADNKSHESLPSPTYTTPSSGHELKMSYGMFSDINRIVGDIENSSALLMSDAMTRDLVIRRLFTNNNKAVTEFDELTGSFDIDISPAEIDGILGWVVDHLAYFLVSTGRAMTSLMEKYKDEMPDPKTPSSNQSSDGTEA